MNLEGNDCDFQMKIGSVVLMGNRIVVEVACKNIELQKKIKQKLDELGLNIHGCGTGSPTTAHFDTTKPVAVTSLGFYDAPHKPNTNHGDAYAKRYSRSCTRFRI